MLIIFSSKPWRKELMCSCWNYWNKPLLLNMLIADYKAWNFISKRARPFWFCKGHVYMYWKIIFRYVGNFSKATEGTKKSFQKDKQACMLPFRQAKGIFSLIKGHSMRKLWISRAPRQWPGGTEAIALVASVKN